MWRKFFVGFLAFSFIGGSLYLWSGNEKPGVTTGKAVKETGYVAAEGRVSVKPDHQALLSAELSGRVEKILVDNLEPVKKGQLLAVIHNTDLQERLRQSEQSYRRAKAYYEELAGGSRREEVQEALAHLESARAVHQLAIANEERDRRLLQEGVIARSRYDSSVAELRRAAAEEQAAAERYARILKGERTETIEAAKAAMMSEKFARDSLEALWQKSFVRSPFDGIVIFRYKNTSEFAEMGDPILEVADLTEMIIEGEVNEIDAGRVTSGQKAIVTSDAFPGKEFQAVVYEVSLALKKRTSDPDDPGVIIDQKILPVKLRLLEKVPLKLGMKVDLKIFSDHS